MNSPLVKNPYKNAEDVVSDILPAHHDDYIERAKKCFGVTIDPTTYDITSFQAGDPQYKDIDSGDCKDNSTDWMKVRFYIFDTQTMESVACYEGEDDACSDVGFDESQSSDSTNDPTSVSGNTQQLAQQILNSSRISISCRHCQEDIQNTAQGKPAYGSVNLDVGILKFLLDLANHGDVTVTSITGAGTGHSSGSNHYTGHAIDLGCSGVGLQIDLLNQTAAKYNGKNNGERCDAPNPYGFAPHDHYDFSN